MVRLVWSSNIYTLDIPEAGAGANIQEGKEVGQRVIRNFLSRAMVGAVLCLLLVATGWTQTRLGGLHGQVSDPSGAVVANAKVTVTPSNKSEARTVTTNGRGVYSVEGLAPGVYTVDAKAAGFALYTTSGVTVKPGENLNLDLSLTVSSVQASVNVEAQPVQVAVSPSQNASAVAIKGSDLKSLADDPDELATQIQELAGPSVGPNGAEIYIDGFMGGDLPPKSAIREIRVNQNPFSAEYDRLGYGRVEILTKPGSDNFHGGASIQGNDSAFNAISPFLANSPRPPYHTLMYSGRLSGPLGKKASFFLAFDRRNINHDQMVNTLTLNSNLQPTPFVAAVPSLRYLTSLSPRIDYALTNNNTLMVRYHFFGISETNDNIGTQSLPSQGQSYDSHHNLLQVSDTQIISPQVINETRFQLLHYNNVVKPNDVSPTLNVIGAFTGGGSSGGKTNHVETHYELQNLTSMNLGKHYVQFGGFFFDVDRTESSNGGFNGTFTFNSLADYQATEQALQQGLTMTQIQAAGYGPSQFSIGAGNPVASVNRMNGSLWAQDDWRARPNLTLSYGLRLESENVISDHLDWAPRFGLSWGLGHGQNVKTVVRAGFGIFYDRFSDNQMIQAARLNGTNQFNYLVQNPAFFPNIPSLSSISGSNVTSPTVYRIAPDLRSPYEMETAMSIERQVTKNSTMSVTYLNSLGERQFYTNDINAPLPGTYNPADPSSAVRPLGIPENIYEYQSKGIFRQNQLITNFRVRMGWVSLFGYYTYNTSHSDTSGVGSFPVNPWNIMSNYGRTGYDIANRVFIGGSLSLPFGIQLDPMIMARSGIPFSISLGQDLYGTGIHNGRPALATPSTPAADVRVTPYGTFNINPGPNDTLIAPNTETGPAAFAFNLRAEKTFSFGGESHGHGGGGGGGGHHWHPRGLGGRGLAGGGGGFGGGGGKNQRYNLTLSVAARNLLNNVNLGSPVGNLNSPFFGQSIQLAGGPYSGEEDATRRIDMRLSFSF